MTLSKMRESDAISRSAVLEAISKSTVIPCHEVVQAICELPALDVAPVVHAYWIEETFTTYIPVEYNEDGDIILHQCITNKCSVCGRYEHDKEPYCNCGARMDGEAE